LSVVDVFSKYGWMIPLKNKTGTEIAGALQKVFKERKPEKLWVDDTIRYDTVYLTCSKKLTGCLVHHTEQTKN